MFENVRADIIMARQDHRPVAGPAQPTGLGLVVANLRVLFQGAVGAVIVYRFVRWAQALRVPVVRQILSVAGRFVHRWTYFFAGIYISPLAEIGPGFVVHTRFGIYIGHTTIGKNCTVNTGVVISASAGGIGDNVYFGPGAKVVGDARIGNHVVIMANSLVVYDVPNDTTAVGVPAKIYLPGGDPPRLLDRSGVEPEGLAGRVRRRREQAWIQQRNGAANGSNGNRPASQAGSRAATPGSGNGQR